MTGNSPLPVTLVYLEPVRKQFAKLDPSKIHEDANLSVLRKVVKKRVKGLNREQITSVLREDAACLEEWLSTPAGQMEQNVGMHFILPLLPDAVEILLSKQSLKNAPEREVFMNTPAEAKTSKEYGILTVKWKRMHLDLYPDDKDGFDRTVSGFNHFAETDASAYPGLLAEFQVGNTKGFKCISKMRDFKRVDYALEVTGGFVRGVMNFAHAGSSETPFEAFFDSITLVDHHKK